MELGMPRPTRPTTHRARTHLLEPPGNPHFSLSLARARARTRVASRDARAADDRYGVYLAEKSADVTADPSANASVVVGETKKEAEVIVVTNSAQSHADRSTAAQSYDATARLPNLRLIIPLLSAIRFVITR